MIDETKLKKTGTINIMPSWVNLHRMCRNGEFPGVYEELLKPCKLLDDINQILDKGGKITIYKSEDGTIMMDDGLESKNDTV